jgi:serine/threonine protein kinase
MKKVSHNSIVQLHDVYQTTNNMYIITELCDCDLYHLLKMRRRLTEIEAVTYLRQIMQGAKYLNSHNVIHRDLKPANILLKDNQCKISDFGFARSMEEGEEMLRSIVGTPLYMSPQLLQKEKYSNKSDLWSIGLIFYEMLHGRTPWQANNELQLINAIHTHKITYSKLISELAKNFIARCLVI